ncbi:MAG: hypothetical protein C0448_00795 [Sphingobacteriaceae bacterium]|nr:hypothetical protein [Sphingobacteriaceae bacterium]
MKKIKHTTFLKTTFIALAFLSLSSFSFAQILTSSPYSRYGLGEINLQTFATPAGMGGSFIAYHQDTVAPFFINSANPAGLAGIRLSTFELGGQAQFTKISSQASSLNKKNINFSYGSVGFPIKRIGGAAFGIMPYSTVGYKITSTQEEAGVGTMKYIFQGDGGINKVFIGTGLKPFRNQANKFYNSDLADTLIKYKQTSKYKQKKFVKQLLSELSIGVTGNYLFGTINQVTDVIYPGSSVYYNSKRQRSIQVSDFTFNGGLQTHFTIDSIKSHGQRRALKEKLKVGVGFFINTPTTIDAQQNNIIYNYSIDGFGVERAKDTLLNSQGNTGNITLPLEMGIGFSVKKGERLTVLMDAATTNWSNFKYFDTPSTDFKNSYRVSAGLNYVPNKLAYGASNYIKRVQYRLGVSYSDGYLDLKNTSVSNYFVSAGLGLPVGIGRFDDIAVVNISAQYGRMGTVSNNLLQEEYVRLVLGFTFNKRWFIKYKYD